VEKDPDEQIQRCIALVFSTFAQSGSGLKTLHFLKAHHILLPRHQTSGLRKGELLWKEPTESMIIEILHNPAYAGALRLWAPSHRSHAAQTRTTWLRSGAQAEGRMGDSSTGGISGLH
jgi:hypothetical protein